MVSSEYDYLTMPTYPRIQAILATCIVDSCGPPSLDRYENAEMSLEFRDITKIPPKFDDFF